MKNIKWLLKNELSARVTCGDSWLVWDDDEWVVYRRKPYGKITDTVARTKNEEEAVVALLRRG